MANVQEIKRLELLSEDIKNEIDELQSLLENSDKSLLKAKARSFQRDLEIIVSNLTGLNDSLYGVFEELNAQDDSEDLEQENAVMKQALRETLSDEDKTYFRIKHKIDLF